MTDDGKIVERIATIETKLKEHDKQLEKQQEKNETQVELNTLLKMQIDLNKEQQIQMNKFGDTIEKVNTNLTSLNETQKQFQSELSVINTRVGAIEESSEKNKIDPMKLFLKILGWSALVVGGIISAYIYKGLGL
ncbi:hypothetical protein AB1L07_01780 [Niallia alba]|uniref:hypothetical protein n=1 Tax=Niallia alba TaxID=2729105 RepID=UPI002E1EEB02|nr:hypothetical protein [Niallia alba]